ncbi:MAG: ABC transporter C-terminal domain-containing protein, partial [Atopobium sp.]
RKRHSSVERKLATASEKLSQCAQTMHQVNPTDFSKLQELQQKLEQAQTRVEALEMEWLTLEEALEKHNHA